MQSTNVDEKAVMDAVDVLSTARGEMLKLEIASQLKVRQVLGAELLRKLREMALPPQISQPLRAREQGEAGRGRQNPPMPADARMPNNGPNGLYGNNEGPRPPMEGGR